ncbi:uncharacterized protein [Salminus brasiliensis]|uniref:uncharacterized protein isoform X2 n=1 Tax=Salminus brasiliensis TaxID=930266 RepID=UPI003B8398AD
MEVSPLSLLLLLTVLYCGQAEEQPKPTLRVDPHTTVYTGDTLTLTCDLQSSLTGWRFTWYKVSQQLECLRELGPNTLSITASDSGTAEYQCIAYRESYGSDYSDRVKITVKEKPKPTRRVYPHTTVKTTVRDSGSMLVTVGVAVGCSLMVLLIITLCLVWCCKKNKDDSASRPMDVTYAEIMATNKKPRGNVTRPNDVTYSQIQSHHSNGQ